MAQAAPVIMAITAIVGAGAAIYTATREFDAAGTAEDIGRMNADLQRAETDEEARRLERQQEKDASAAKARAFASGVDPESESINLFLTEVEQTQTEELEWLKRSGYSRADILEEEGEYASAQAKTSAYGSLARATSYASDIYSGGQQAGWWGSA